ncbi:MULTISPECIES: methyl-accepting chemotaxis protein [Dickeya]|uniref:methyl-accepting chemotaxis protein n=1 Tax=Dickeya TaxID=204037 RepID=UPI0021062A0C|nr:MULTISPECIES: methyl-accepting chemotaxis protein [Dickeya]
MGSPVYPRWRSASAAREIKELIDHSVQTVDAGNRLVEKAGASIQGIEDGVRKVSELVGEISVASQEQSLGIEQVNMDINKMEQTTLQNASPMKGPSWPGSARPRGFSLY